MLFKKYLILLIFLIISLSLISCNSDDKRQENNNLNENRLDGERNQKFNPNNNQEKDELNQERKIKNNEEIKQQTSSFTPSGEAVKIMESLLVEMSMPEVSLSEVDVSLSKENVFIMNSYSEDLPEDGNLLKLHDVCYDETIDQGYGAGILSRQIAVFKNGKTIDYIDTRIGTGTFELKYVFCDKGEAFIISENRMVKIDGESLEITEEVDFEWTTHSQGSILLSELNYLIVPVPEEEKKIIYDTNDLRIITEIGLDKYHFAITKNNNILAVEILSDQNEMNIKILDGENFEEIEGYSINKPINRFKGMGFDKENEELWVLTQKSEVFMYELNNLENEPNYVFDVSPESERILYGNNYIITLGDKSYEEPDDGALYGGITVIDTINKKLLRDERLLHHHTNMELDEINNDVYITNNNDNSVTRYDIETGELLDNIDLGESVEHGVISEDGTIFISNRLGGSSILSLNPSNEEFIEIETGQWPVGSAYSKNLDYVFTYDMLSSTITVIDGSTSELINTYNLDENEANSDAIGELTIDQLRDILYITIPEQNKVVVMDGNTGTKLEVIYVEDYGIDYSELQGPAKLYTLVYEPTSKVFVHANDGDKIFVYDGLNNFELVETISFKDNHGTKGFPYGFMVDNYNEKIYIGNTIIDPDSYEEIGSLDYGTSIAAIDQSKEFILTVGIDKGIYERLYAVSFEGELLDEIELNNNQYISARFAYNQNEGKLYAFYMVPAEVWEYNVY